MCCCQNIFHRSRHIHGIHKTVAGKCSRYPTLWLRSCFRAIQESARPVFSSALVEQSLGIVLLIKRNALMHWIRFLKKSEKIWLCCVTRKALIAAIQRFIFNSVWILKCLRRLIDHSTFSKSFETLLKSNWLHAAITGNRKRGGIWEGAWSS